MKINAEVIARTALGLLNEVGLDGLTMRLVAKELDVRAAALYWHVKNKQELLDAMATLLFTDVVERLEAPGQGETWSAWLTELIRQLRRALLRYRDGARMFAGTHMAHPAMHRCMELTLRTLRDAGFTLAEAARAVTVLLHYTVGFTIEQQARDGAAYQDDNPYRPDLIAQHIDASRFPLFHQVAVEVFDVGSDADFEAGLQVILAGITATRATG
ncbi:TetR/AcrR family transcriptional regulator C-terminal domain-containing protein [Goodfellowiella coeruleoviolacea]|uniref:TetR/AcrR family transcriptional regulator C-terminal domain-containing protein n=1 Tax=Goodfellowiella coeruleoviolacea TaxID=334858 RepID=UPI000A6F490A|nr:TetR/AcrR family transcriptional regulator C-terminal domain-containing protein [Goodfellowiella coeruleoviolacea]